jgi:hypothetical protein
VPGNSGTVEHNPERELRFDELARCAGQGHRPEQLARTVGISPSYLAMIEVASAALTRRSAAAWPGTWALVAGASHHEPGQDQPSALGGLLGELDLARRQRHLLTPCIARTPAAPSPAMQTLTAALEYLAL